MSTYLPQCNISSEGWNAAISKADAVVFKLINSGFASHFMDHVMVMATILGGGTCQALICVAFIMFGWWIKNVNWRRAGYAGLVAAMMSTIIVQVCKALWDRPRPLLALFDVRVVVKPLFTHSFPSGHTITAFAVAFACCAFVPKLRYILIPFAILTGFSRVYVGVHFPLDVLFAGLAGAFIGLAAAAIIRSKGVKEAKASNACE